MSEFAVLKGKKYDKNKVVVKGLFKQHGLTFDRGLMMRETRFIWKNDKQSVEGHFTKDERGNTTLAEFEWIGKENTQLKKDLKRTVIILGGEWQERDDTLPESGGVEEFDIQMRQKLVIEETNARGRQWTHSPILKPMAKEFLEEREEQFGVTDINVDDLVIQVHKSVDEKLEAK